MTRRALIIGSQTHGLNGADNDAAAMAAFLGRQSFLCRLLTGSAADREGILEGLRALIRDTADDDTVAIYYSGHGGRIMNPRRDSTRPHEPRAYHCLIPTDHTQEEFRGIFSGELSAYLADLSLHTRNITVILDCCHAELQVRSDWLVSKSIPIPWRADIEEHRTWLRAQGIDLSARAKYVESNPNVVRLAACKASQTAYERTRDDGRAGGLLTEALLETLADTPDLSATWHALGKIVRARVTADHPTQEPELLGPVARRIFDTVETSLTDVLTYFRRDGKPYLSGGSQHGVTRRSRYLLMPMNANRPDRDLALADAEVAEVHTDKARIALLPPEAEDSVPQGTRAFLYEPRCVSHPVRLDLPPGDLRARLTLLVDASPRVHCADATSPRPIATISLTRAGDLLLRDVDAYPISRPWPIHHDPALKIDHAAPLQSILLQFEQLTRVYDLLNPQDLEDRHPLDLSPTIEWGQVESERQTPLPAKGATLTEGDRIYLRITSHSPAPVYASVLGIGVERSVKLLTASEPAGVEVRPQETYTLGQDDVGQLWGIPLRWPSSYLRDRPQPMALLSIITDIPVDLRSVVSSAGASSTACRLDDLLELRSQRRTKEFGSSLGHIRHARSIRHTVCFALAPHQ